MSVEATQPERLVEVAVPNATQRTWTYRCPPEFGDTVPFGTRVRVRFGPRLVVGYVVGPGAPPPAGVRLSNIEARLDPDESTFEPRMVEFLLWLARYYRAGPGEVFRGAHPVGTNEQSIQWATLTAAGKAALDAGTIEPEDVARLTGLRGGPLRIDALAPAVPEWGGKAERKPEGKTGENTDESSDTAKEQTP